MEQNAQINTFEGGMDLDTDLSKIQPNKYRWASNIRLITDSEGTSGVLQNIEDIKQYDGGLDPSEKILGTSVTNYYESGIGKLIELGTSKELLKKAKTKNFEDAFIKIIEEDNNENTNIC